MATLSDQKIEGLLEPFLTEAPESNLAIVPRGTLFAKMSTYLDLLLKWNARTNLTAIRDPESIVQRHFGESLFAGLQLAPLLKPGDTVMDFGSGAGFPGLPIQVLLPELTVLLAESQGKKASFLREAVRTLDVKAEVWSRRVEEMPATRRFDAVVLRAVDDMDAATKEATKRVVEGGVLGILGAEGVGSLRSVKLPESEGRYFVIRRVS